MGVRWCDVNKGDNESPDVRARLVVQDVRSKSTIAVGDIAATFAATPPIECLRLILSLIMSLPIPKNPAEMIVLRFLDISRADPHVEIEPEVYINLPPEDPAYGQADVCGLLLMNLYGTRGAGKNFEQKVAKISEACGCV